MSLTALQAATLLTCHDFAVKFAVTGAVRLYSWIAPDSANKTKFLESDTKKELCAAQMNASEYTALLTAPLFYMAAVGEAVNPVGALLTVGGQVAYVWTRTIFGYPTVPVAVSATTRYIGFAVLCHQLVGLANKSGKK